jgi:hypothetical protein
MTEQPWKTWTPKYDGHAPDDWEEGAYAQYLNLDNVWVAAPFPRWSRVKNYRYRAKQPDLLAQCLALPQADRDSLIAELQKPVRDWADDIAEEAWRNYDDNSWDGIANHLRSMCLSKEDPLLTEIFNFIGGIDGAAELRGKLLKVIRS